MARTSLKKIKKEDGAAAEKVIVINEEMTTIPDGDGSYGPVAAIRKKDRFLPISILVAAALIGGAVVFSALYRPSGGTAAAGAPSAAGGNGGTAAVTAPAAVMALGPRDAILGSANAPVTLIEYGD